MSRVKSLFGFKDGKHRELKQMVINRNPDGTVDSSKRVLLVFPIFTHVFPMAFHAFSAALLQAARFCPDIKFDVMVLERQLIHSAMNQAAESCVQNPFYEGLITFDDDCIMPSNVITRLMAHYQLGGHKVVAAHGFMRSFPHTTTVGRLIPEGMTIHHKGQASSGEIRGFNWLDELPKNEADEHGLIDCDFCGMPAMFIAREVLMKMQQPPFGVQDGGGSSTHDIYFCNRAKDAGYSIKVDVTLECGHIAAAPIVTSQTRSWARKAETEYQAQRAAGR